MPHSDFFILAEQCHSHEFLIWLKYENNQKNEDKFECFPDLKINEDGVKINIASKWRRPRKWRRPQK